MAIELVFTGWNAKTHRAMDARTLYVETLCGKTVVRVGDAMPNDTPAWKLPTAMCAKCKGKVKA